MGNTRYYQEMIELLRGYGYNSYIGLVRALMKTEPCKNRNINSVRAQITQIFNRQIALPKTLERALLEICNDDRRIIDRLKEDYTPNRNLERALELKLNEVYKSFRERFLELDWKGKADMCSNFETYINGYLAERKIDEKEK